MPESFLTGSLYELCAELRAFTVKTQTYNVCVMELLTLFLCNYPSCLLIL